MAGGAGAEAGRTWSGRLLGDAAVDLDLRPAWRLDDAVLEQDAIEFWKRMGILPTGVSVEERVRELAAGAYRDGRLVGVATAVIAPVEALRCKFAFYRCAVAEEERRSLASTALTVFTRDLIERWSAENPDEGVLGLAAIIESSALQQRQRDPLWANSGLNLVAFTSKGKQLRVAWFRHARVPVG
ncbi:MAG TPA: hypothetical protein VK472_06065 [Allosphingosinicella sp.]|nr:hypothetical protein [Allosphingosinicella sp.]